MSQEVLFHALDLVPIGGTEIYRVALLVPESGISLLRSFSELEVFLSLTVGNTWDMQFASVDMAFVQVRRGRNQVKEEDDGTWRSLNGHLLVRDTTDDDPCAELMVSAMVPANAIMAPLPEVEAQFRPQYCPALRRAPPSVKSRMGGVLYPILYSADLANADKTALLAPGGVYRSETKVNYPLPMICPTKAVSAQRRQEKRPMSKQGRGTTESAARLQSVHEDALVKHSIELTSKADRVRDDSLVYRVTLFMANREAKELLAAEGTVQSVPEPRDPCSVHVRLGQDFTHVICFPFPVAWKAVNLKVSKEREYAWFTVPPLAGPVTVPFSMTGFNVEDEEFRVIPRTWCFPACVPMTRLPKLDLSPEWSM